MHVSFIGAGAMGGAILKEVLRSKLLDPKDVTVARPNAVLRQAMADELGVNVTDSASEAVAKADVVLICVKPHMVDEVMRGVQGALKNQFFISIAAGLTLETLEESTAAFPGVRWVRVVPNVACLVGASASTYYPAPSCTPADLEFLDKLLGKCGIAVKVPAENLLDAATGVAGSGIAYIFMIIEALADGGVRAGLPRAMSTQLASQTVLGGALLQMKDNMHPGALKDTVCSPGGTTIEAVATLERLGLRSALIEAVNAAYTKAQLLGERAAAKKAAEKAAAQN